MSSYKYGIFAEYFLIFYLILFGYKILARRYKTKFGEIDIIAVKNNNLKIFEVKARKTIQLTTEIVSKNQTNRIFNALKIFLSQNNKYVDYNICYNIILFRSIFNFKIIE